MYKVFLTNDQVGFLQASKRLLYSQEIPDDQFKIMDPVYKQTINSSGSFEFKIHEGNNTYSLIQRIVSTIIIERDEKIFWIGRVLDYEKDLYGIKSVYCEGALSFLNDTIQLPSEYSGNISDFFTSLLTKHNQGVFENRKIYPGNVTVTDKNNYIKRYTNYENTLACLSDKLVDTHGGYLVTRYGDDGKIYLDYLENPSHVSGQTIRFGENIVDYAENYDWDEMATILVPRGSYLDESSISALYAYLTVESVNNGSPYVQADEEVINKYGKITKVMDWPDVTEASNLLRKAKEYLSSQQFDTMTISVKAVDLSVLSSSTEAFNLFDEVRVVCPPAGLDKNFQLSEINIPLDAPEEAEYVLGKDTLESLSKTVVSNMATIKEMIQELPTKQDILKEAKDEATSLIQQNDITGYVSAVKDENGVVKELLITDNADYNLATKVWRWNLGGLGYSKNGYNGPYETALTMNGAFVADFITTGTMLAERILGGTLSLGSSDGSFPGGDIKVYDNLYGGGSRSLIGGLNKDGLFFRSYWLRPDDDKFRLREFLAKDKLVKVENGYLDINVSNWQEDGDVFVSAVHTMISGNSIIMGFGQNIHDEPSQLHQSLRIGTIGGPSGTPGFTGKAAIIADEELRLGAKNNIASVPNHIILWDDDYDGTTSANAWTKPYKVRFNKPIISFSTIVSLATGASFNAIQIRDADLGNGSAVWDATYYSISLTQKSANESARVLGIYGVGDLWGVSIAGNLFLTGALYVNGAKNRLIQTQTYGSRTLNSLETPECLFSDFGSATIDQNGECRIDFDPIFAETIVLDEPYRVHITSCSEKQAKWVEKHRGYFIVHGEPEAIFDWMLTATQIDAIGVRLEEREMPDIKEDTDAKL